MKVIMGPAICETCRGFAWWIRFEDRRVWSHAKTYLLRCPAVR